MTSGWVSSLLDFLEASWAAVGWGFFWLLVWVGEWRLVLCNWGRRYWLLWVTCEIRNGG